jgi:hypothetical protein
VIALLPTYRACIQEQDIFEFVQVEVYLLASLEIDSLTRLFHEMGIQCMRYYFPKVCTKVEMFPFFHSDEYPKLLSQHVFGILKWT